MPQTGKPENTIQFNYIIGDELINVKYRDGRKNFKLYKGTEKVFYNINSIIGYDNCIITEGEMDVLASELLRLRAFAAYSKRFIVGFSLVILHFCSWC